MSFDRTSATNKTSILYTEKRKESMRKSTSSEFLNIRKENSGKVLAKQTNTRWIYGGI